MFLRVSANRIFYTLIELDTEIFRVTVKSEGLKRKLLEVLQRRVLMAVKSKIGVANKWFGCQQIIYRWLDPNNPDTSEQRMRE